LSKITVLVCMTTFESDDSWQSRTMMYTLVKVNARASGLYPQAVILEFPIVAVLKYIT